MSNQLNLLFQLHLSWHFNLKKSPCFLLTRTLIQPEKAWYKRVNAYFLMNFFTKIVPASEVAFKK